MGSQGVGRDLAAEHSNDNCQDFKELMRRKIFFINEYETKIVSDDRKLREFITSRPTIKNC